MNRINLDDHKFVVFVAALLSSALAFVILRALLTNGGIIEAIDIQWNQNFSMFEYFFHTWNFYNNGSNIIFVSQFPVYGWVLVFRDVALAQRFVYFLTISLISFNMFVVAFYTLKRTAQKTVPVYLGSIVASLIYTLNPLIFSEIFHISFLWAYSLFPLVFYFGWESFNTSSRRKVLVSALLLSLFFAFMADAWGMLVALIILVIMAISSAVMNGRKNLIHRFIPNFLLTLLIMGIATVLLAAYWLLPYITQKASGPVWDPFSIANLVSNSQYNGLTNIFGLHSWSAQPFYSSTSMYQNQLLGGSFFSVWQSLTLIVPIVAVSAVLLRRSKLTLSLSGLLLVGIFLATGVKYSFPNLWPPPIGEFYKWLTFYSPKIIPNQTFLLKYPYLFLAIVCLAVALLSAFLVVEVFRRVNFSLTLKRFSVKSHALPTILFISIISLIALVGAPLLTGNLNGALSPVTLPDQYKELNAFFSSQNGSFRVMYVPQEANFNWSTNPWANKIEYWGSGATPLMYGWGISASPNTGFLGNLVYDYISTNQTQYLGKLLALGNVRYIVFHNDSENGDPASVYPAFDLYFTEYKDYFNSFLSSTKYTNYFLSTYDNGTTDDTGYLNFILKQEYLANYENSSEYQNLLNSPEVKALIDSDSLYKSGLNSTEIFNSLNQTVYDKYNTDEQYKNSSFYKNLPNSRAYLNNSLNSQEYHSYLNNFSKEYQNFIDSPIYNNSHNYLNSSEYLILTGSQYFANSKENKNFINSVEYKGFLEYYLLYTSNEYAKAAYDQYGASYQSFHNSPKYAKYQAYLNYQLSNYPEMFNNLQAQKDLKLVPFSNANLFVFENTEMMNYFQAYSKANLVVGGLDTIGSLSSIGDLYLNDSAFLFVENQHMSESDLASILNSKELDKNLLFYDSKTFDDLVLDNIDTRDYIAPGEIFAYNTSTAWWLNDAVTSFSWTPIALNKYVGEKYDFGLGYNLLYTTNVGAAFDLPVEINKSNEYSIWLRLLFSPDGGNMTFSIDGKNILQSIDTASSVLNGFNWVNLSNVTLISGSHTLKITSESGLNAVNLVALPAMAELGEHLQNLTNLINQSNAKIVYIMDKTFLSSKNNNNQVSIFAPKASSYMIIYQGNKLLTGNALNGTVDGKVLTESSTDSFLGAQNWYSIGPVDLGQGTHYISFNSSNVEKVIVYSTSNKEGSTESLCDIFSSGAQPYVVTYEKTDPVSFTIAINASKTFLLGYEEPYDQYWQTDIPTTKVALNSVNNGFLVSSNDVGSATSYNISVTYPPEKYLQLGLKISAVTVVFTILAVVLILKSPKFLNKKLALVPDLHKKKSDTKESAVI